MATVNIKIWCFAHQWPGRNLIVTALLCIALGYGSPALAQYFGGALIAVDPAKEASVKEYLDKNIYGGTIIEALPAGESWYSTVARLKVAGAEKLIVYKLGVGFHAIYPFGGTVYVDYPRVEKALKGRDGILAIQQNFKGSFYGSGKSQGSLPDSGGSSGTPGMKLDDPYYPNQWHHGTIHSPTAWSHMGGKSGATIAVLDTGITSAGTLDLNLAWHEKQNTGSSGGDITVGAASQYPCRCTYKDGTYEDKSAASHGTRVAHIAAAVGFNGMGTIGVSPKATIFCLKVAVKSDSPTDSNIITAIAMCMDNGVKIINLSANGGYTTSYANKNAHPVLHKVFEKYYYDFGGLIFNSATWGADPSPFVPYLIVVAGLTQNHDLFQYATGPSIWFVAPAGNIWCPDKDGKVSPATGLSYGAPMVAGIASLIWGARPDLSNGEVAGILKNTAVQLKRRIAGTGGFGTPDAGKAMDLALTTRHAVK